MALAKITILGFKKYLDSNNDDLFKNLILPAGIDKDTLVNNIYNECADFEVLYSDPYYMQFLIGTWSNKHQRTWQKWIDALNIDYDPLYNYDRREEWEDIGSKDSKNITVEQSEYSNHTEATASTEDSAETTNKISAFDSNTLQNDTQASSTGSVTNSSTGDNSGETNANNTLTGEESTTNRRVGRAYGNIGVTTSQQMLQSELDIARFNIINQITDMFVDEFMIPIYF